MRFGNNESSTNFRRNGPPVSKEDKEIAPESKNIQIQNVKVKK